VATSTQVLYYVPPMELAECFRRIYRSLRSGGYLMATVHLLTPDLDGISPYAHLQYSDWIWRTFFNSRILGYNRLKAPDYRALLTSTGFELRHFEVEAGTDADLQTIAGMRLDRRFRQYRPADLAARHLFFVAQKP